MTITAELLNQEKGRFNALSQEDALCIAKEAEGSKAAMRSCWYCNGAHERLKNKTYFVCFSCGIAYVKGFPAPILGMRMRGIEIDDATMAQLAESLKDAI
jgi:hypothetical protein